MNFYNEYGDYGDGYEEFENAGFSNMEELYVFEDVEGPLHLGEDCDTKLNYFIDLAESKENAIQIRPASVDTGFTRQDEDYDLKVQKANIVREVREVKLKNTKSFGVTFSEPGPPATLGQTVRCSPIPSTEATSEGGNFSKSQSIDVPSSSSGSASSANTACAYPACESMSNLQFYSFGSNLVVVARMIALAGNCEVGYAFQLEGLRSVWDLSTDSTLLGLLHSQGLTEALLAVVCKYSSCGDGGDDNCCAYERSIVCALAMVTLVNLSACEAAMAAIAKSGVPVLEVLSAVCGKYIDCRAQACACVDDGLGPSVHAAVAAPELARQSRLFVERLTQHLQLQSAAVASAACPVSARVLPNLYKFGGAGGSIVRVTHG